MRGCADMQNEFIDFYETNTIIFFICTFAYHYSIAKVFPSIANSVSGKTLMASSKSSPNVL